MSPPREVVADQRRPLLQQFQQTPCRNFGAIAHRYILADVTEIAAALQDQGKTSTKKVNGRHQSMTTFPLIQKLCTKTIYQAIQTLYNPDSLTTNISRGREPLVTIVLVARKRADVHTLHPFFHQFAEGGKTYIINNDPVNCGMNIPIKQFQDSVRDMAQKARSSRTANDGLRLALTLLDPKYRAAVATIMTHRKDRLHSDITGDHVVHFFEQLLEESFQNKAYRPPQVDPMMFGNIDADEIATWDPNDPQIFQFTRSADWLVDTWRQYVRRKYKTALDRWNKQTGGGDGQPSAFVEYCDNDARWLVAVFLKDMEANYLLASNAGGRMPHHMQMECGFELVVQAPRTGNQDISSLEGSGPETSGTSNEQAPPARSINTIKRMAEDDALATKKLKSEMTVTFSKIATLCDEKKKDPKAELLESVWKMNKAINDTTSINSMSVTEKETYMAFLMSERGRLICEMSKMMEGNSIGNGGSTSD